MKDFTLTCLQTRLNLRWQFIRKSRKSLSSSSLGELSHFSRLILKTQIKHGGRGVTNSLPFFLNSLKDAGGWRGAASCDLLLQPWTWPRSVVEEEEQQLVLSPSSSSSSSSPPSIGSWQEEKGAVSRVWDHASFFFCFLRSFSRMASPHPLLCLHLRP